MGHIIWLRKFHYVLGHIYFVLCAIYYLSLNWVEIELTR